MIPISDFRNLSKAEVTGKYSEEEIRTSLGRIQEIGQNAYEQETQQASYSDVGITEYDHNQDFFSYKNLNALKDNLGPSAGKFFSGLAQAASSPGATYEALKEMGISGMVDELDQRYGTLNRFKETATEDPFGVTVDVASLPFTGFGRGVGALKTAGTAVSATGGRGAKIAGMGIKGLGHAAEAVVDPVGTSLKGIWGASKAIGKVGAHGLDMAAELATATPQAAARATRESSETLAGLKQLESTGRTWSWLPGWKPLKEYVADEDFVFDQYRVAIEGAEENINTLMNAAHAEITQKGFKAHLVLDEVVNTVNEIFPKSTAIVRSAKPYTSKKWDDLTSGEKQTFTDSGEIDINYGDVDGQLKEYYKRIHEQSKHNVNKGWVHTIQFDPGKSKQASWRVGEVNKPGATVIDTKVIGSTEPIVKQINDILATLQTRSKSEFYSAYQNFDALYRNLADGTDKKIAKLVSNLRENMRKQLSRSDIEGTPNEFGNLMDQTAEFYKATNNFRKVLSIPAGPIDVDRAGTVLNKIMDIMKSSKLAERRILDTFKELQGTNPLEGMLDKTKHGQPYKDLDPTAAASGAYMRKWLPGNIVGRSLIWGALAGGVALGGLPTTALFGIAVTSPAIMGRFLSAVGVATGVKNQIVGLTAQLWKKPYVRDLAKRGYTLGGVLSQMAHREQLKQQKGSRR